MIARIGLPSLALCLLFTISVTPFHARAQEVAPDVTGGEATEALPSGLMLPDAYDVPSTAPPADLAQVALLHAWIADQSGSEGLARVLGGVTLSLLGATAAILGGWLVLDPQFHTTSEITPMLTGVLGLGVGVTGLAAGVLSLSTEFGAEDRLRRLATAEEEGLDERELGRFEGELRSYADNARVTRPILVAADVGIALGGGLAMVFTAGSDHLPEAERFIGLVFGGAMVVAGVFGALLNLLVESPYERAWRMYQEGVAPDGSSAGLHFAITPYASPDGGGVAAAGMF